MKDDDTRPLARQTWGPNPEAWFPWSGDQGRPNLFRDDEVRVKYLNGVYSNRFQVCDRGWIARGEWEVVAIGVMLENSGTLARMEALTGYRALRTEAILIPTEGQS